MRDWKDLLLNYAQLVRGNVAYSIHRQQKRIIRMILAVIFIVIGSIFFLNALAVLVGRLLWDSIWGGYLTVGLLLMVIGYFIKEKNKM